MLCHLIRTCSSGASASLLGLCSSLAILFGSPLAMAAPNPQTNPHFTAAVARIEQQDLPSVIQNLSGAICLDPTLVDAYKLQGIL